MGCSNISKLGCEDVGTCIVCRDRREQGWGLRRSPSTSKAGRCVNPFVMQRFKVVFLKKKYIDIDIDIYINTHIYMYKNPSAKCDVLCLLFLGVLLPGRQEIQGGMMGRVEKGKPEGQGGWEEV